MAAGRERCQRGVRGRRSATRACMRFPSGGDLEKLMPECIITEKWWRRTAAQLVADDVGQLHRCRAVTVVHFAKYRHLKWPLRYWLQQFSTPVEDLVRCRLGTISADAPAIAVSHFTNTNALYSPQLMAAWWMLGFVDLCKTVSHFAKHWYPSRHCYEQACKAVAGW